MATRSKPPWKRPNPKPRAARTKLSPSAKRSAQEKARKSNRPYPNLVDNMRAAREQRARKT